MAQSGLLTSTPRRIATVLFLLTACRTIFPLEDTQNLSSEPSAHQDSSTAAAQWPGFSLRSGMAMGGRGRPLAAGCTLVKPTRIPPCQSDEDLITIRWILSLTPTGRLLNTRPFLNVAPVLVASRQSWLRLTFSPKTWQWKVRGPRQDPPQLWDIMDSISATSATLGCWKSLFLIVNQ